MNTNAQGENEDKLTLIAQELHQLNMQIYTERKQASRVIFWMGMVWMAASLLGFAGSGLAGAVMLSTGFALFAIGASKRY